MHLRKVNLIEIYILYSDPISSLVFILLIMRFVSILDVLPGVSSHQV